MDALGVAMIAAGSWLVYAAVKGQHPWTMFGEALTGQPVTGSTTSSGGGPIAGTVVGAAQGAADALQTQQAIAQNPAGAAQAAAAAAGGG